MSGSATAPIAAFGDVTLGKMVTQASNTKEGQEYHYLRAAHVQPYGHIDLSVSEKKMWFSDHEIERLTLELGDVVIVEGGAGFGRSAVVPDSFEGWGFQNSIVRVRPNPGASSGRYLSYALQMSLDQGLIELEASSATIPHFTAEKVSRFRIPSHPLLTQLAIADYLDRETSEIDAMAAELDSLVSKLEERRIAEASTAVRDGQNKYVRKSVHTLVEMHSGDALSSSKIAETGDVTVYGGNGTRGFTSKCNSTSDKVLIGRQGALCGNVHLARAPFWATEHAIVCEPRVEIDARWLAHALRDLDLGRLSTAAAQPGISASAVGREVVPFPPLKRQEEIADQLDVMNAEIDSMIADAQELKALLAERRSALIAEVATGRKEVPVS